MIKLIKYFRNGYNVLTVIVLLVVSLTLTDCGQRSSSNPSRPETTGAPGAANTSASNPASPSSHNPGTAPFNRHPDRLFLTRHAHCRMDCRHITEKEIREILDRGTVNDRKSEPLAAPNPKYAIEGNTDEGQHLRIVVAVKSPSVLVVVTCIELGMEWHCDCH